MAHRSWQCCGARGACCPDGARLQPERQPLRICPRQRCRSATRRRWSELQGPFTLKMSCSLCAPITRPTFRRSHRCQPLSSSSGGSDYHGDGFTMLYANANGRTPPARRHPGVLWTRRRGLGTGQSRPSKPWTCDRQRRRLHAVRREALPLDPQRGRRPGGGRGAEAPVARRADGAPALDHAQQTFSAAKTSTWGATSGSARRRPLCRRETRGPDQPSARSACPRSSSKFPPFEPSTRGSGHVGREPLIGVYVRLPPSKDLPR